MDELLTCPDERGPLVTPLLERVYRVGYSFTARAALFNEDINLLNQKLAGINQRIEQAWDQDKNGYVTNNKIILVKLQPDIDPAWRDPKEYAGFRGNGTATAVAKVTDLNGHLEEVEYEPTVIKMFELGYLPKGLRREIFYRLPSFTPEQLARLKKVSRDTLENLIRRLPPNVDSLEDQVAHKANFRDPKNLNVFDMEIIDLLAPFHYYFKGILSRYHQGIMTTGYARRVVRTYLEQYSDFNPAVAYRLLRTELREKSCSEEDFQELLIVTRSGKSEEAPPLNVTQIQSTTKLTEAEAEKLQRMYITYFNIIYRYCFYKVANHHLAEDLVTTVFINAAKYIGNYELQPGLKKGDQHWLIRIARNAVIDHWRSMKTQASLIEPVAIEERDLDYGLIRMERATELLTKLRELPDEQREVLTLRFIEQQTHVKVARLLGKPAATVRVIQHRALEALRRSFKKEEARQQTRFLVLAGLPGPLAKRKLEKMLQALGT